MKDSTHNWETEKDIVKKAGDKRFGTSNSYVLPKCKRCGVEMYSIDFSNFDCDEILTKKVVEG